MQKYGQNNLILNPVILKDGPSVMKQAKGISQQV